MKRETCNSPRDVRILGVIVNRPPGYSDSFVGSYLTSAEPSIFTKDVMISFEPPPPIMNANGVSSVMLEADLMYSIRASISNLIWSYGVLTSYRFSPSPKEMGELKRTDP